MNSPILTIFGLTVITIGVLLAINIANADKEVNDDFENAEEIAKGITYGNVSSTDKYDIYKINLNSGEILYANLTRTNNFTSIRMSIYDENKRLVIEGEKYESEQYSGDVKLLWITNSSKINYEYYINITHLGSIKTPYKLEIGIEKQNDFNTNKDAGDDFNNSTELSSGIYKNNILGNYDTSDYYSILLKEEEYFKIKMNSTNDYELYIYDKNYTIIAYLNNSRQIEFGWALNSTKENHTYYIHVSGKSPGKYSLDILIEKQNDFNTSKDAGDNFEDAILISQNRYFSNIIGGNDTIDFYKINMTGGDKIIVKLENITSPNIYLFDENKEEKINTTSLQFSFVTSSSKQNFIYYILIIEKNFTEYSLEIIITKQNDANSGKDASDIFDNVFFVSKDIEYEGILQDDDKKDIYGILANGEEIKIELSYNYTASIFGEDKIIKTTSKIFLTSGENKTYYIAIEGNGKYKFKIILTQQNDVNRNKDAGNNFENSEIISEGKYLNNKIGDDDRYDYYKINISAEKTVIIKTDKNLNISIYDFRKEEKGRIFEGKKIWHSDFSQTIYIRIEGKTYTIYSLDISFSNSIPSNIIGFNTPNATSNEWTKNNNQIFSWLRSTSDFGIRGYYYSLDGRNPNLNSKFTTSTSFSWINIPDGVYTIKISAVDYADAFGNISTFILKINTKPPTKLEVEIKEITENSITISWKKSEDEDFLKYEIYYSTDQKFPEKKWISIENKETTSYTITGLNPGTRYYVKVVVLDATIIRSEYDLQEISTKQRAEIPIFLILAIVIIAIAILFAVFFVMGRKKMPKKEKKKKKEEIKVKREEVIEMKKEIKPREIEEFKEEEISGEELWRQLRRKR